MLIALMVSCFDGRPCVLVSNMSCSTIVVIVTERAVYNSQGGGGGEKGLQKMCM